MVGCSEAILGTDLPGGMLESWLKAWRLPIIYIYCMITQGKLPYWSVERPLGQLRSPNRQAQTGLNVTQNSSTGRARR
jgi:hypothetical protein